MKDLQLTINIKVIDTLREQFPQDEFYNHVSLKLIGRLGDEDIRFLSGYSADYELDEDTYEIIYHQEKLRWNTLDLDLSEVNPDDLKIRELNEVKALRSIILPKGHERVNWCYYFGETNTTTSSLVISEGTKTITKNSFYRWGTLEKVSFPSSLEEISPEAFVGCNALQSFDFPESTDHFMVCDHVLFSPDKSILIACPPGLKLAKYEIPEGTTLIAERAFKQNPYVKEIIIPKTVVRIQDYAFENCASLERIEVDSANPVYYSRHGILFEKSNAVLVPYQDIYFYEHRNKMICVPAAIDKTRLNLKNLLLHPKCFSGCKNIRTVNYDCGNYSHRIDGAFDNCYNVEEISLANVEVLPRLSDCQKLKILNINENFLGGLDYSIVRNKNLKEVNISNNTDFYSKNGVIFNNAHELIYYPPAKEDKEFAVPKDILTINYWELHKNPYLQKVILPPSIEVEKLKEEWLVEEDSNNGQSFMLHSIGGKDIQLCLDGEKPSPLHKAKKAEHKGRKKDYKIKGIIVGTYDEETIPIKLSLYDEELERIKAIIKSDNYNDLRDVIKEEFPELYETIDSTLRDAAYEFYANVFMNNFAERDDDEPRDIELTGEEYSCPIPDEWK